MKTHIRMVIVFFIGISSCFGEDNKDLSRFIYSIPIMDGMELVGKSAGEKSAISENIEIVTITKVLQNKTGQNIPVEKISKFYYDHFVSLKFRAWQKETALSGHYYAPDLVTQGNAYIRSQGHISFWIPKEGNSITFYLYQRRDFDIRKSQPLLDKIQAAFKIAAGALKYKVTILPHHTMVSDWPEYLENECFVDRIIVRVSYGEVSGMSDTGDNKSYSFYCSIFPTYEHAKQWRDKIIEEHNKIKTWPDWFVEGVGISPFVINNIVVEYKGEGFDKDDPEFGKRLLDELNKIEKQNK